MRPAAPKLRFTFVALTVATFAVFGVLVAGLTFRLRSRLRVEVQQREAEAMYAVAVMQIRLAQDQLGKVGSTLSVDDVFTAVLESSRMNGVMAVQLFDPAGHLRNALPAINAATAPSPWWPNPLSAPQAKFHPDSSLEEVFGLPTGPNTDATRVPVLEIVIPLRRDLGGGSLGVARYWIDGHELQAEFRRMDRNLWLQTGLAFAGASCLGGILLAWGYRRLSASERRLVERSQDLARANQELDFAAKTGALGAISAHLIHGLKNPLAGLEGFVADAGEVDKTAQGEARQTALETARRLRTLVNDVVSVLRDEASGGADYNVPLSETLAAIEARTAPVATAAGVKLVVTANAKTELKARTANLAGLVLANLLTNAIEASPAGTEVRLDANPSGGDVEFLVSDHGGGLPDAARQGLFHPIRSTKPGGGGMGLAISHRLARHAGGDLTLLRSDTNGTAFRLVVPTGA